MTRSQFILSVCCLCLINCLAAQNSPPARGDTLVSTLEVLQQIEVYHDTACQQTLAEVALHWEQKSESLKAFALANDLRPQNPNCYWTRLTLINPGKQSARRVFYFPRGWREISCYLPEPEKGSFQLKKIGVDHGREEVLFFTVPAQDTQYVFVQYPSAAKAYYPMLWVQELLETEYVALKARSNYKFLLLGALAFPLLFFLTQFLVQREKLTAYYIVFLLGASLNLLTILDTINFFGLTPKVLPSMEVTAPIFVASIGLTIFGLTKYLHEFLNLKEYWLKLKHIGDVLLLVFSAVVIYPLIFRSVFTYYAYETYLFYFRILALILFVYILAVIIWAVLRRVQFSAYLLLAFLPLVLSGVWYAISFVRWNNYTKSDLESLSVIIGFIMTSFLFGIILGVRNNAVKAEKLRLEERALQLKELDEFKSRFYTNITHEFRTPLTVVKGVAQQIKGQEQIRTLISRNSDRLLQMINQLLDLSRLEQNRFGINYQQSDIIPYLQYLTESCHSLSNNKKINLAFFSMEERLLMDFDEDLIQQILINLLSNAIKFTPEYGSVKVIAKRVKEPTDLLEVLVKDTGRGIPKEEQSRIFDRFYQVDSSSTRTSEGSGIGLALVKELVRLLSGTIEVESEVGRGTTFRLQLPIQNKAKLVSQQLEVSAPTIPIKQEDEAMAALAEKDPVKPEAPLLLVIEDNIDLTDYIFSCLDQEYNLVNALNGKEGVDKAYEVIPDVILCDVMMPEMDGFEVCRQLKGDRRTSHIPIILLTAKATQEDKNLGFSHGADAYLTKPFDRTELLLRLRNLTIQSKQLRERLTGKKEDENVVEVQDEKEATFLKEVDACIKLNFDNELFDTNFLCRALAMSRTQLHRKLKALTDQSTATYIRFKRLEEAHRLLKETDLPIGEIADRVGFKDFSHFSRTFSRAFNIRPSDLRK